MLCWAFDCFLDEVALAGEKITMYTTQTSLVNKDTPTIVTWEWGIIQNQCIGMIRQRKNPQVHCFPFELMIDDARKRRLARVQRSMKRRAYKHSFLALVKTLDYGIGDLNLLKRQWDRGERRSRQGFELMFGGLFDQLFIFDFCFSMCTIIWNALLVHSLLYKPRVNEVDEKIHIPLNVGRRQNEVSHDERRESPKNRSKTPWWPKLCNLPARFLRINGVQHM